MLANPAIEPDRPAAMPAATKKTKVGKSKI
jgi:hypothetical protein